jgi:hypothetical protein
LGAIKNAGDPFIANHRILKVLDPSHNSKLALTSFLYWVLVLLVLYLVVRWIIKHGSFGLLKRVIGSEQLKNFKLRRYTEKLSQAHAQ